MAAGNILQTMNTITQSDIELSERLRKACLEKGITEPRFVAQDANGSWYHHAERPICHHAFWLCHGLFTVKTRFLFVDKPNQNWRDTLMEWNPDAYKCPVSQVDKFMANQACLPQRLADVLKNTCDHCGKMLATPENIM